MNFNNFEEKLCCVIEERCGEKENLSLELMLNYSLVIMRKWETESEDTGESLIGLQYPLASRAYLTASD